MTLFCYSFLLFIFFFFGNSGNHDPTNISNKICQIIISCHSEEKADLLVLLFLALAAILNSLQAEIYDSEALQSGHAACEI